MIDEKFVDRFARNSGIKDKFIAEREVILTYALEALNRSDIMKHLAFKGGTALRKIVFGSSGRFSMDLDFTFCAKDADRDAILQNVLGIFNDNHHGISFKTDEFYFSDGDRSFGGDVEYSHNWNTKGVFKLQISLREDPM
jgi:Nucleotidyl transferase AbiEii toxin, Type IV TA system